MNWLAKLAIKGHICPEHLMFLNQEKCSFKVLIFTKTVAQLLIYEILKMPKIHVHLFKSCEFFFEGLKIF